MSTVFEAPEPDPIPFEGVYPPPPAPAGPAGRTGPGAGSGPSGPAGAAGAGWWSSGGTWEPAGWADPAASAFRASYADPARVQTLAAGPLFDVLSVEMAVGLETAQLLLTGRQPLGPVALDNRLQVRRVGFLLPPDTFRRASGFAWWCRSHAMRTVSHGDVVALPPLIGTGSARFQWLIAPGARGVAGTDPAVLLTGLRQVLRAGARAVGQPAGQPGGPAARQPGGGQRAGRAGRRAGGRPPGGQTSC
jgi:hypothetical protein